PSGGTRGAEVERVIERDNLERLRALQYGACRPVDPLLGLLLSNLAVFVLIFNGFTETIDDLRVETLVDHVKRQKFDFELIARLKIIAVRPDGYFAVQPLRLRFLRKSMCE